MLAKSAKEHPFEWKNYVRKVCMVAYNPLLVIHLLNSCLGGKLYRLPIDVLYVTSEDSYQSHGECQLLKCRLSNAFDIVREHVSKEPQ